MPRRRRSNIEHNRKRKHSSAKWTNDHSANINADKMMKKQSVDETEQKWFKQPHSIVIHRGQVGQFVRRLEKDLRSIMEPFTATKLKVMRRNNIKDFVVNGAVLGVTHLFVLTRGESWLTLRIICSPQGPTLTFRVKEYTLAKHVIAASKHKLHFQRLFTSAPLVVMSGFNSNNYGRHMQLTQSMFQNIFPTISIDTINLSSVRRCVMINYNDGDESIYLRHYAIKAVPAGLSKSAKKLVQGKIPDLSKYKDIGDYFLSPGQLSESEYEFEEKEVELPQNLTTRGCSEGQRTNIRLYELGPRLTLQLAKIEEGIDEGEVLYHAYIRKTARELMQLRKELPKKRKLKERRRMKNECRVINRLKNLDERKRKMQDTMKQEREKIIRTQKEVIGEEETDELRAQKF